MSITGGCLCRAVRYSISAAPIVTPTCGTHLFTGSAARPHLIFVRAGTLDDPELAKPAMTIWTTSAPSWACFDERIPKVERQPPPAG
jgi:hypothetical protein